METSQIRLAYFDNAKTTKKPGAKIEFWFNGIDSPTSCDKSYTDIEITDVLDFDKRIAHLLKTGSIAQDYYDILYGMWKQAAESQTSNENMQVGMVRMRGPDKGRPYVPMNCVLFTAKNGKMTYGYVYSNGNSFSFYEWDEPYQSKPNSPKFTSKWTPDS